MSNRNRTYAVTFSRTYEVSEELIMKRLALAGKLTERPDEDEMEKEHEAEDIARSWFEAEMSKNCEDSSDFASASIQMYASASDSTNTEVGYVKN